MVFSDVLSVLHLPALVVVAVLAQGGRMISWSNSKRDIVPRGGYRGVLVGVRGGC